MCEDLNAAQEQARGQIVDAMRRLLVGPMQDEEVLRNTPYGIDPSDYYLSGILWPRQELISSEEDEPLESEADEEGPSPDGGTPLYSVIKPSSIGMTCAILPGQSVEITARGARYLSSESDKAPSAGQGDALSPRESTSDDNAGACNVDWARKPFCYRIVIEPGETKESWITSDFLTEDGSTHTDEDVAIHVKHRDLDGMLVITASLINQATRDDSPSLGSKCLFQTELSIHARDSSGNGRIAARPPVATFPDDDLRVGDLLYRDSLEFATGHGIATVWEEPEDAAVAEVRTDWMPTQEAFAMSRQGHESLTELRSSDPSPFAAEQLADPALRELTLEGLAGFCNIYKGWIETQEQRLQQLPTDLEETARNNLATCSEACGRMAQGVEVLRTNDLAFRAFCLANETMNAQASGRHRGDNARPLVWFPFQLAFILLAIESITDSQHSDRGTMDLLWFPTGGGKTEAYLGLTAFTIFLRRMTQPEEAGHVDVLMRYTLRLLTVQQFQRAAAMTCAADQIRRREGDLGSAPISIGLFVGQGATPNRLVSGRISAKDLLNAERNGEQPACTPRLLLDCPLCGGPLPSSCYNIDDSTPELLIRCSEPECPSNGDPLPVYTVDEDIYRVRPSLLIGTVDKFAQLPRNKDLGGLFGSPAGLPPELIIQDELHLISGPLGSITGLYETCIDLLCSTGGRLPKVIGSTATIGRAKRQVRGLFDRDVLQFPPAAIDAQNSFFAVEDREAPNRIYAGLSSSGRSPKFTLQATAAACLAAAEALTDKGTAEDAVDPYWTLLLYFNSLRELGGAKVMMRDDVRRSLRFFANRLESSGREMEAEPCEITSRIPSTKIPEILKDLAFPLHGDPCVGQAIDTALASNMISVGMDIPRLGLMLVNGQPKSTSEYIQATSRIGRGIPGLILTCLNASRPRDMSHFEHFAHYHQTLYRRVEVTSVTPWSSRARDRALHAVFIAAVRHLVPNMSDRFGAISFDPEDETVSQIREWIQRRAGSCDLAHAPSADVVNELDQIIERWRCRAGACLAGQDRLEYWATLQPHNNTPTNPHLMRSAEEEMVDERVWPTPNSMREVEPSAYYVLWPNPRRKGDR